MNTELLLEIKDHILVEPTRLMMDDFISRGEPGEEFYADNGTQIYPACGTVGCIAGWACILSLNENELKHIDPEYKGAELLGLDCDSGFSTNSARLFFTSCWPKSLMEDYEQAGSVSERANIAAKRIDHFIATEGRE